MISIDPKDVAVAKFHSLMLGSVGPRPIAFASTISAEGIPNLSPFSFFNAVGANPPTLIFSPSRRVRNGTTKHTYENIREVGEVVINIVNYAMVQQTSLASTEYPKGVSEFVKAGFTPEPSVRVRPFRVKESPAQFECLVKDIIELGQEGGGGSLIICEILMAHISESVLDENQAIDQHKIDLVGRLGANWYCRASGEALFEVEKPLTTIGIGVDNIPDSIKLSPILTGNNLGQLGNVQALPTAGEIAEFKSSGEYDLLIEEVKFSDFATHRLAKKLLDENKVMLAWKVLLS